MIAHRLSFADIEIGQRFTGPGRTLTETDLTLFSMMTGDWHPIHADAEFAKGTAVGQRIIHGPFGIAVAMGMVANLVAFNDRVIGMLDIRDWTFREPLLTGDTVRVEMVILDKRVTSDGRRAVVERGIALVTGQGARAQEGRSAMMLALAGMPDDGDQH